MLDINKQIAIELNIKEKQVLDTIKLIKDGNTIPFISRYRKEVTGGLNDEILRNLNDRLNYYENLNDRKETIIKSLTEQDLLTEDLKTEIDNCLTLVSLEDIYRPYKPKKKTRALIAIEKGFEPLADKIMLRQVNDLNVEAANYLNDEIKEIDEVLKYTSDILAERFYDEPKCHEYLRKMIFKEAFIETKYKKDDEKEVYKDYYDFKLNIKYLKGYQVLAIDRGEKQNALSVKINTDDENYLNWLYDYFIFNQNTEITSFLKEVINDSYNRLLLPSIKRDIRAKLSEDAQVKAIEIFKKNLKQLLLARPIANQVVLGWDPAFRTGCKLAVVDNTGKVLDTKVIFVTAPASERQINDGINEVINLINEYNITLISCGNGTASRESEQIIAKIIAKSGKDVKYIITNESGASVYSASKLASEEFPSFDVGQRSAISIARRVQDPLAELVKIEPQAIGVGQYQHDMNQKELANSLDGVVEDCVNSVGVELNTASYSLLSKIAGISKQVAKNIVEYREMNGKFINRKDLLKVNKLGPKLFEQCAGFLRISDGNEILDNTSVHPESYDICKRLINKLDISDIFGDDKEYAQAKIKLILNDDKKISDLEKELNVGKLTLIDILNELLNPARDPRLDAPEVILKADILKMEDLKKGLKLKGTVRNITDFGIFVDIGVHQDGLVHKSKMSKKYVKNPIDIVSVNDIVDVWVEDVDIKRGRISLTMIE